MLRHKTNNTWLYCGDNVEFMKELPDNTFDLTVTSPPYDDLRNYNGYSFDFENVAKELYRVTKDGGVVVWVVGDATVKGSETGTSFRQALYFMQCGFNLHDTMIYEKNGAAYPAGKKSVRYSQVFEYMFVFSKGKPRVINLIKDKENKWAGISTFGASSNRQNDGSIKSTGKREIGGVGYRNNIWKINNGKGFGGDEVEHPAVFPEQLANDHILSWSNEGDLIFDPFMGSNTTGKMALLNNRQFVGIDCSEEYVKISIDRIVQCT